jgi:hypothetical protein
MRHTFNKFRFSSFNRSILTLQENFYKRFKKNVTPQPGDGVVQIAGRSPVFQQVLQGERVNLEVQVEPGAPVTFYTPQVGEFPNRLTTHSVAADNRGIARTSYLAGAGTLGIIDILAASPVHAGQVRFKVRVSLPE